MKSTFYECQHPPSTQEMSMVGPLGGDAGDPGAPTINARKVDGGPQAPLGAPFSIRDLKGVLFYLSQLMGHVLFSVTLSKL
jgi:hypothetical protein